MDILSEIAATLGTTEEKVNARIAGLKLGPICSRCGGSGSYSFNQIDGSRCYGCNGSGHTNPKTSDLPGILEAAKAAVSNGDLERYFQILKDRSFCKRAMSQIFAAWTETSVAKALGSSGSHMIKEDEVAGLAEVRSANKLMADAQQRFSAVQYDKTLCPTKKAEIARASIDAINAADFDVPAQTITEMNRWMSQFRERQAAYFEEHKGS